MDTSPLPKNSSEAVNMCTKYRRIYKWKGARSHHKNITSHKCGYQKGCPGFDPYPDQFLNGTHSYCHAFREDTSGPK